MYLTQIFILTLSFLLFQFENLVESDEVSIFTDGEVRGYGILGLERTLQICDG